MIKISESNTGIITEHFIFAFCKIFMTRAQITMDYISHDEYYNKITWEVSKIEGDELWVNNIFFNFEGGSNGGSMQRSCSDQYLTVGDQITVSPLQDGVYVLNLYHWISNDILFRSDPMKY